MTVKPQDALAVFVIALAAGCAAPPPFQREPPAAPAATVNARGLEIALAARELIGAPYRYGGSGPDVFDCSGLVSYVHRRFGYATPRTAAQQFAAAQPVPRDQLEPGDLVFFRLDGWVVSHVGIYAGHGRFVHAPQTGERVREAGLDEEYFLERYAGAGRLYPATGVSVPGTP